MGLLHALEGLVLGITGKRGLWTALAAAADTVPQLRELDYVWLGKRCIGTMRPRRGQTLRDRAKGIQFGLGTRRGYSRGSGRIN